MKFLIAAAIFLASCFSAFAAVPKVGTVMELPAYCKTEADVKQFADIVTANDNEAFRAFLADPANTCIVLSAVGLKPIRAVLIEAKRYKNGIVIGKFRAGKDVIYGFGRE